MGTYVYIRTTFLFSVLSSVDAIAASDVFLCGNKCNMINLAMQLV